MWINKKSNQEITSPEMFVPYRISNLLLYPDAPLDWYIYLHLT